MSILECPSGPLTFPRLQETGPHPMPRSKKLPRREAIRRSAFRALLFSGDTLLPQRLSTVPRPGSQQNPPRFPARKNMPKRTLLRGSGPVESRGPPLTTGMPLFSSPVEYRRAHGARRQQKTQRGIEDPHKPFQADASEGTREAISGIKKIFLQQEPKAVDTLILRRREKFPCGRTAFSVYSQRCHRAKKRPSERLCQTPACTRISFF